MCLFSNTREFKTADKEITAWKVVVKYGKEMRGPYFDDYVYGLTNCCRDFKDNLEQIDLKSLIERKKSGFTRLVRWIGLFFNDVPQVNESEYIWRADNGFHSYQDFGQAYDFMVKLKKSDEFKGLTLEVVRCEIPAGAKYHEGYINGTDSYGYCSNLLVISEAESNGHVDEMGRYWIKAKMEFTDEVAHKKNDTLYVLVDNPVSAFPGRTELYGYRGCFKLPGCVNWVATNMSLEKIRERLSEEFPEYFSIYFESEKSRDERLERERELSRAGLWPFI